MGYQNRDLATKLMMIDSGSGDENEENSNHSNYEMDDVEREETLEAVPDNLRIMMGLEKPKSKTTGTGTGEKKKKSSLSSLIEDVQVFNSQFLENQKQETQDKERRHHELLQLESAKLKAIENLKFSETMEISIAKKKLGRGEYGILLNLNTSLKELKENVAKYLNVNPSRIESVLRCYDNKRLTKIQNPRSLFTEKDVTVEARIYVIDDDWVGELYNLIFCQCPCPDAEEN